MTHYQVLELPENAPAADIRRAYRRLVLLTHPDRTPDPAAHTRYLAINAAYEVLSDPTRRAAYDASRHWTAPPAGPAVSSGRARDAAVRARHTGTVRRPANDFSAEYARFLRLARPLMIAALALCASLGLDVALARPGWEIVVRTTSMVRNETIHYTSNGRLLLEDELPVGTRIWVTRTPLWRTALVVQPAHGSASELPSLYSGPANLFWLGLVLSAGLSLVPIVSKEVRLMAILMATVCLILTLSALLTLSF